MKKYTLKEIENYLLTQTPSPQILLAIRNLSEEALDKANPERPFNPFKQTKLNEKETTLRN